MSTAFTLALLTVSAFVVVYKKLPRRIRRFLERHSLLTDAVCLAFTYMFLGGTLTALLAAGMVGIIVSGLLHVANHPENFMYLYDFSEMIESKLKEVQDTLNKFGQDYRTKKLKSQSPITVDAAL